MAISCIILAGGLATRMGGCDKGLITFLHQPMVQHVIRRVAPQVDELFINANREIMHYQTLGYPVLEDAIAGFIGPLAGIHLGLTQAKHDYLLTVPCDAPSLPHDLVRRLHTQCLEQQADIAVAKSAGASHPVISLCKKSTLMSLTHFIQQGGRKVSAWQKTQAYTEVDFSDVAEAFVNLNTPIELSILESMQLRSDIKTKATTSRTHGADEA